MAILNSQKGVLEWLRSKHIKSPTKIEYILERYKQETGNKLPTDSFYANQVYTQGSKAAKAYKEDSKLFHKFASWFGRRRKDILSEYHDYKIKQAKEARKYLIENYSKEIIQYTWENRNKSKRMLAQGWDGPEGQNTFKKISTLIQKARYISK